MNPAPYQPFLNIEHSTFQGYGHYRGFWLPFLDEPMAYEGEKDPPWYAEEPVSPYDAARWSAMTYYHHPLAAPACVAQYSRLNPLYTTNGA